MNLSRIKKYAKNKKYFIENNKLCDKLHDDLLRFKNKHYLNNKNLEVLQNFRKNEIKNNKTNLLGSVNIKDYYENKKLDAFTIMEFCRRMNQLNEKVAYKYRNINIFTDKFGFNFDDVYKINHRKAKLKHSIKTMKSKNQNK